MGKVCWPYHVMYWYVLERLSYTPSPTSFRSDSDNILFRQKVIFGIANNAHLCCATHQAKRTTLQPSEWRIFKNRTRLGGLKICSQLARMKINETKRSLLSNGKESAARHNKRPFRRIRTTYIRATFCFCAWGRTFCCNHPSRLRTIMLIFGGVKRSLCIFIFSLICVEKIWN